MGIYSVRPAEPLNLFCILFGLSILSYSSQLSIFIKTFSKIWNKHIQIAVGTCDIDHDRVYEEVYQHHLHLGEIPQLCKVSGHIRILNRTWLCCRNAQIKQSAASPRDFSMYMNMYAQAATSMCTHVHVFVYDFSFQRWTATSPPPSAVDLRMIDCLPVAIATVCIAWRARRAQRRSQRNWRNRRSRRRHSYGLSVWAIASNLTNDRCNVCGLCQCLSCRSSLLPPSVRVAVCPLALAQKADKAETERERRRLRSGFTSLAENVNICFACPICCLLCWHIDPQLTISTLRQLQSKQRFNVLACAQFQSGITQ